ncbi:Uncharacterised protein [uncultured archaeon]|nr:Uncharacterised protein [uncultured archaeon]
MRSFLLRYFNLLGLAMMALGSILQVYFLIIDKPAYSGLIIFVIGIIMYFRTRKRKKI